MSSSVPPDLDGLDYVQPLGSGGYADVFLYEQQMPRMKVAVKVLKASGLTPAIKQQFIDEANTMAQLADHPYIVQVFRSGTSEDARPYLVMKYYPPPNLAQRARSARFSVEEVLRTGIHLSSAVETAHRVGVIHRDIKPANVLVSQYGTPGLTDFGIAGRGGALEDLDDDLGVSVPWAPPEVLFGQSNGDVRADVYSLSATLWQLLVGRSPFEVPGGDNSTYALMPRIRSNPPPTTGRGDVPPGLERLLAQAMAKDPAARPASALEFARSLQAIEQEERFSRTAIVVLDEQGHSEPGLGADSAPPADSADRTRVRTSSSVPAPPTGHQSVPTPPAPPVPPGQPAQRSVPPPPLGQAILGGSVSGGRHIGPAAPTRIAEGVGGQGPVPRTAGAAAPTAPRAHPRPSPPGSGPSGQADQRGQGSGPSSGPSSTDGETPATAKPRRGVQVGLLPLIASIVGILVFAAVVGAVLYFGGNSDDPPPPVDSSSSPAIGGLNGTPVVTFADETSVNSVPFTVDYPGLQDTDVIFFQSGPTDDMTDTSPSPIPLKPGQTTESSSVGASGRSVCVRAKVTRGENQATAWSPTVCRRVN